MNDKADGFSPSRFVENFNKTPQDMFDELFSGRPKARKAFENSVESIKQLAALERDFPRSTPTAVWMRRALSMASFAGMALGGVMGSPLVAGAAFVGLPYAIGNLLISPYGSTILDSMARAIRSGYAGAKRAE